MTKEIRRLSVVLLFMFLSLFVATSWIQVVQADSLAQTDHNTRSLMDSYEIQRGSIIAGGSPIVTSVPADDEYQYQRVYSDSPMWSIGHRLLQSGAAIVDRHRERSERRPLRHRVPAPSSPRSSASSRVSRSAASVPS